MRSALIDAGPLIALFDKSDSYHKKSIQFIKFFQGALWTTWPVITEVLHMLDFSTRAQIHFLTWIDRGGLQMHHIENDHIYRVIELIDKFDDVPMDLADGSLIVASEQLNFKEIATIDSDFYIYRNIRNQYLQNIFM
ncbi:MAG: PIN domain-containing protein [Cyclobacteriaceae bacterium]